MHVRPRGAFLGVSSSVVCLLMVQRLTGRIVYMFAFYAASVAERQDGLGRYYKS